MKTVALVSGGKDSCFNMMCCIAEGHEIYALANLRPEKKAELDSYMFQTVGCTAVDLYAEAMGICLYTCTIKGTSISTGAIYEPHLDDEVEDLYQLLHKIKHEMEIEAVSVGAILSDYQRVRVENVCSRLGLTVLSYMWRRDQEELLQEMIDCGVKAKIIKVAALGLNPDDHLMLDLEDIFPHMLKMKAQYGLNVCGEGGEYETFVYDCPLFLKKIFIEETETVIHANDAFAPVGYINFKKCHFEDKEWDPNIPLREKILQLSIMTSSKWIETHVPQDAVEVSQSGGGDTGAARIVMCVPDMRIRKEDWIPQIHTDGNIFSVAGILAPVLEGQDVSAATEQAINSLRECLNSKALRTSDITSVSLYIGDMTHFAMINHVYRIFFDNQPPVRLCIQANLPRNIALQMDCQGHVADIGHGKGRKVMHVQALSHWAPANIGPYSQAVQAGEKLYLAGIVPLVPASLALIPGGIITQCAVSLNHVRSIMTAMNSKCTLGHCPLVICYLTNLEYLCTAQEAWEEALQESLVVLEKPPVSPMVQYCVVPALPKSSLVEWHMYAWPFLEDDVDIRELKLSESYGKYTITSRARFCPEKAELFSCNITVDAPDVEDFRFLEQMELVVRLLVEYSKICEERNSIAITPLVKVLFSPTVFNYPHLQHCFSEAISKMGSISSVHPPVVSLVSVNCLQSRQQLLAWCQ